MSLIQRVFTERRRVVLPLLVFLVADGVALGAVFWLQRTRDSAEESRIEAVLSLEAARKQEASAKGDKASMARADIELKTFYGEVLPKNFATAVNVTNFWLSGSAEAARLRYRSGQFESEAVRESRLTKASALVTLVGDYADIRRFLYEVETAQEFVIIERVELSQPNLVQGNAQLELALTVATYFLGPSSARAVSR